MANNTLSLLQKGLSLGLLVFSIVLVSALIFQEQQTTLSKHAPHPIVAYIILWMALLWLSMVEGSQASMVGLPPVDQDLYKDTHPITRKICAWGHAGDNLDRYLMGRQFMVLVLVFVINLCGAPVIDGDDNDNNDDDDDDDSNVLGLPSTLVDAFLTSGLAMILMTAMIGQLTTQVTASHCMLDYLNTHFATLTVATALAIEASGLLHVSYLIQQLVAKCAGQMIESNEEASITSTTLRWRIFFWSKVTMSCGLLVFAVVVTLAAIWDGQTTLWAGVPKIVAVVMFFLLMAIVGMLEGMQIAFFAVSKLTDEERNSNRWARWCCDLLFQDQARGLPGFMIGRQLCVVACFFVMARVTTIKPDNADNVLGMGNAAERFFETGLLGAFITTILASIAWQLIASAFPLAFLGNPLTYILLRVCLLVEATGIASGSWVLATVHKKLAGYRRDELYIGTAEERAAEGHEDRELHTTEVGHLTGGAYPANHDLPTPQNDRKRHPVDYTQRRKVILTRIARLRDQVKNAPTPEQRETLELHLKIEVRNLKSWNDKEEFFMPTTAPTVQETEEEPTETAPSPSVCLEQPFETSNNNNNKSDKDDEETSPAFEDV